MIAILLQQKLVGHAGDVIANDDMTGNGEGLLFVIGRHRFRVAEVETKEARETFDGMIAIACNRRVAIEIYSQEMLQAGVRR